MLAMFASREPVNTCNERRRGLGGPLEACDWCHGVCLHANLPSLPALILHPDTTSSRLHRSGRFCHSMNPPTCPSSLPPPWPWRRAFLALLLLLFPSPLQNSDANIFTLPIAYILSIEFKALSPPMAAIYCCTIYLAIDDSCILTKTMQHTMRRV